MTTPRNNILEILAVKCELPRAIILFQLLTVVCDTCVLQLCQLKKYFYLWTKKQQFFGSLSTFVRRIVCYIKYRRKKMFLEFYWVSEKQLVITITSPPPLFDLRR